MSDTSATSPESTIPPPEPPAQSESTTPPPITALEELDIAKREARQLRAAFTYIAACLRDEAQARDWCSEYADFVNGCNAHLATIGDFVPQLLHMSMEYEVRFRVTAPNTDHGLNPLENHVDIWLTQHDLGMCTDFYVEEA